MIGSNLEIFFSCSFDPAEKEVNELVRSVCAGMGLRCLNLSAGFSAVPPDQAKDFISNAAGLIAVATKRDRLDGGDYIMPSAVREEISIAFGIGKPILIIGEDGVRYDGFMNNYGTRLTFSRDRLTSAEFIERLVYSVCKFREEIASAEVSLPQYAVEYFSESTRNLIALDYDGKDYWWTNSTTKHLKFEAPLQRGIPSNVWPSVPMRIDPEAAPAEWDVKIESSSRPFEVQTEANIVAPTGCACTSTSGPRRSRATTSSTRASSDRGTCTRSSTRISPRGRPRSRLRGETTWLTRGSCLSSGLRNCTCTTPSPPGTA